MPGLYFLVPTLLAVLVSFLFVRAAAIALMMTGLEKNRARFQALSAFSGTGFTTKEAEFVVNHPQRRKIIRWLMITGNAGIVTVIVTATSSFTTSSGFELPLNIIILILGLLLIYRLAKYRGFTRRWEHFIEKKLIKSQAFEESATEDLLHFLEGYGMVKKIIHDNSPLVGKTLGDARLNEKGILVLGIERGKSWIPTPRAQEILALGDNLVVYGPLEALRLKFEEATG